MVAIKAMGRSSCGCLVCRDDEVVFYGDITYDAIEGNGIADS